MIVVQEIWKDIQGYEGFYQISNFGRVKSLGGICGTCKRKEKIRALHHTKDGYVKVRLLRNSNDKTYRVHRLVAEAFIPNPNGYDTVNHIDGNKDNNCVDNLEWCDRNKQMQHAYKLGLKQPVHTNRKLSDDDIRYIRKNYKWQSQEFGTVALSKKFGVTNKVIGDVVRGIHYKNVK